MAPFGGEVNAQIRLNQFRMLYNECKKLKLEKYFMLAGDTNMRYNEEVNILKLYKNEIHSCWEMVPFYTILKNSMYTFYRNYFSVGAKGATRYDKMFYGNGLKCKEISVFDKCVSDDKYHFLSDHRGILGVFDVQ